MPEVVVDDPGVYYDYEVNNVIASGRIISIFENEFSFESYFC